MLRIAKPLLKIFTPAHPDLNLQKLLTISVIFAGFFLFSANYYFDPGGHLFLKYAEAIIHGKEQLNANVGERDVVYPLLLILSGYTIHHSLIGIAIINTIMAISMPLLVYLTVKPVLSANEAYYIGLASIFSLFPFFYIKYIHHDHPYIFFNVVSVCFLSRFIANKKSINLYAMTLAVIIASLVRPAGNIAFPLFIIIAFLFGRGRYLKYLICIFIFLTALFINQYHRHIFFSQFGKMANTSGAQVFYNLYLNSKIFGIKISPDLGPNTKKILDNAFQYKIKTQMKMPDTGYELGKDVQQEIFYKDYVYRYSPQDFVAHILATPCWDYWRILCEESTQDDTLFLKTSMEILKKYPFYPLEFTLRNTWLLLYKPGYAFTRYTIVPFSKTGLDAAFPFTIRDTINIDALPSQSFHELQFDTLAHKPIFLKYPLLGMKKIYSHLYMFFTKVIFFCMLAAWLGVIVYSLNPFFRNTKINTFLNYIISKPMIFLIIAISLILFQNILIISAFVDPMIRYHNHLLPDKIILAGIGLVMIFRSYHYFNNQTLIHTVSPSPIEESSSDLLVSPIHKKRLILTIIFTLCLFLSWTVYILFNTL